MRKLLISVVKKRMGECGDEVILKNSLDGVGHPKLKCYTLKVCVNKRGLALTEYKDHLARLWDLPKKKLYLEITHLSF